jgi:hypothetical protein
MNKMPELLHSLAIKKHANAGEIAPLVGMPDAEVAALLQQAVKSGRAIETQGKYTLSPLAQIALAGDYSRHFAELRGNQVFAAAYESFERINVELKTLITRWQTVETGGARVANDHSNRDYDTQILDRLGQLHERAEVLLARLESVLPRFSYYRTRLLEALERAEGGKIEWVSSPKVESYHTLWFELHEDLLRLLGKRRSEA